MNKNKKQFPGQREDEVLIAVFRKHWFSFLKPVLIFVVLFCISIVILWFWLAIPLILLIVGFVLLLLAISYLLYSFLLWWWDIYILTNIRVINFDQKTLFHRVVSEAELMNIQDTTYEIEGIWQTVFNYGQVKILTASSGQSIVFEDVPAPHAIQDRILDIKNRVAVKSD